MKSYVDSFLGDELVLWLYDFELITLRKDAIDLAQALLDGELIEDLTNTFLGVNDGLGGPRFQPTIPYKLKERRITIPEEGMADELDPEWLQSIEVSNEAYRKVCDKKRLANENSNHFSDSLTAPVDLDYYLKNSPSASVSHSSIPCPELEQIYLRYAQCVSMCENDGIMLKKYFDKRSITSTFTLLIILNQIINLAGIKKHILTNLSKLKSCLLKSGRNSFGTIANKVSNELILKLIEASWTSEI